jgi:hypothetical protein
LRTESGFRVLPLRLFLNIMIAVDAGCRRPTAFA